MQTVNQIKCQDCQSVTSAYTATTCRSCFERNAARETRLWMNSRFPIATLTSSEPKRTAAYRK